MKLTKKGWLLFQNGVFFSGGFYGLHLILFNVLLFSSPHIDIIAKILLGCEIFIFSAPVIRIILIKFEVDKSFFFNHFYQGFQFGKTKLIL